MIIADPYIALLAFAYSWLEAGQLTYAEIQHTAWGQKNQIVQLSSTTVVQMRVRAISYMESSIFYIIIYIFWQARASMTV